MKTQYQHWSFDFARPQQVHLILDVKNNSTNVLSQAVLHELDQILDDLQESDYQVLVFRSKKKNVFIIGADVHEFSALKTPQQALKFVQYGQSVMDKIEHLPMQTIALIDGFCLGGGLELALACHYCIVSDNEKVKLGLPEIKLGIHPGYGGSVRSVKRLGVLKAMDLMLSGRFVSAYQAKKMGLVDAIIPQRHLLESIDTFLLQQKHHSKRLSLTTILNKIIELPVLRHIVAQIMYKKLQQKISQTHYPAPFQLIDNWLKATGNQASQLAIEAQSVSQLMMGSTAKNLLRVFHLQDQLKKIGRQSNKESQHVHIMGAGVMGSDIAIWCAYQGYRVSIFDLSEQMLAKLVKKAFIFFQKKHLPAHKLQQMMDNLIPDPQNQGLTKADVLIEAIIEKVKAKQDLFQQIESQVKSDCLLVTNTSSIMLEEISQTMKQPERLIGLHFFNPVAKMPLIEVIYSPISSQKFQQQACYFATRLKKLPLPVKAVVKPGAFSASDLAVQVGRQLLLKMPFAANAIDDVIIGCVMPYAQEANIARQIAFRLGLGDKQTAWTVQRNCASGMQAVVSAMDAIRYKQADLILCGGTEAMSRSPWLWNKDWQHWLGTWLHADLKHRLSLLKNFKLRFFQPVIALLKGLTDPLNDLSMGQTAEILAKKFAITRHEMDSYALQSHQLLASASMNHVFSDEISPLFDKNGQYYSDDNGLREKGSLEKLAKLRPVFDKYYGNVTAANSAQISDGASLLILASERAVKKYHLKPVAKLIDNDWQAVPPEIMGVGAAHAIAGLLHKQQMNLNDIDYWEINEAFSAQVLACVKSLDDPNYYQQEMNIAHGQLGKIPMDKLNIDGGGISLGHPVGASGARIILHLANLLKRKKASWGIASMCIGGGQGGAILLQGLYR